VISFRRPALADELVQALRGRATFSDASNGVFLAAPRRTGKSTFLQHDLAPALERGGVVVVYVDLWSDRRRDPADLIADAITRALEANAGAVTKTARKTGLKTLSIGGLSIDLASIGKARGATLADALGALHRVAKKPVALIVDEAQQALASDSGEAAMAALKSARDQLNGPGSVNLMLVMSGSDRDKLLRLVNANSAPFFGSQITSMPPLGPDYIDDIADRVVRQRPDIGPVEVALLHRAFEAFGHRPQFFMEALGAALSPLADSDGKRFEQVVMDIADERRRDEEARMEAKFIALRPLEQAILWRLLDYGARFRPYDGEALRFYGERTGEKVTPAMVQHALEGLRDRTPSLVWKSARGEYAVDDAAMHRWFAERVRQKRWPPAEP